MQTGHKPQTPRCALEKLVPTTVDTEQVKHEGFHEFGILVVNLADERLTWVEKQMAEQIGKRLYGKRRERRG